MEAGTAPIPDGSGVLARSSGSRLPDQFLKWTLSGIAFAIFALIAFFFIKLYSESNAAFSQFGFFGFTFGNNWNPAAHTAAHPDGIFMAWPMVLGTLVTSAIALLVGVPIAVATALFLTELCPQRLRGALTVLVELLAAVPSVVYGLWGLAVLIPAFGGLQHSLNDTFAFLPFVGGPSPGKSYFFAGIVLAIMILPIVSAVSREVISTVPPDHKEAALALGATRWEMIRMAVLPYSRSGITGAAMLGLGRAVGETIAVTLVVGGAISVGHGVFDQGNSLAAVIANEFKETSVSGSGALHRSALIAAGLVLFVLTLFINGAARGVVARGERKQGLRGPGRLARRRAGAAAIAAGGEGA